MALPPRPPMPAGMSWAILEGGPHNMREVQVREALNEIRMPQPTDGMRFRGPVEPVPDHAKACVYQRARFRPRMFTYQGIEP